MKNTVFFQAIGSILLAGIISTAALAQTTIIGEGRSPVAAGDAAYIRNAAKQEALRDAVIKAIKDATALDASDSQYAAVINEVAKQLRDVRVREEIREGADFVTRIEALVDRRQIKNAIRGTNLDKLNDRSFSILMMVDEFVTTSRDLRLPLRDFIEYSYDAGADFKEKTRAASARTSASNSALAASSSVNVSEKPANGNVASANEGRAAMASSKSAQAASYQANVEAKSHEKISYRRLVEYQDTSKPVANSVFLSSFSGNLRDYDLRLLDASMTRSKFFGDRKITLSALSNSADMAKFSEFARKSNADFLMVGSSTVVAGDLNPATGLQSCAVTVELKVFATAGSENISSAAESTEAAGQNIEDCAAKASTKVASLMAPEFANRTLGYWADRAARGRQYTVEFKGSGLSFPLRMAFAKALREMPSASDVETKENSDAGVRATVTIKGKVNAMEQVFAAVSASSAFSGKNLDGLEEGETLVLCLDSCSAQKAAKTSAPARNKK